MCGPMKNPKVETRSRDSNSGPQDCKADALPHDHGHHTKGKFSYMVVNTETELFYTESVVMYTKSKVLLKDNKAIVEKVL